MAFKFIKLNATQNDWYDTGINLTAGERILITASGKASAYFNSVAAGNASAPEWTSPAGGGNVLDAICGGKRVPASLDPKFLDMALVGSIGSPGSNPFLIGKRYAKPATATGRLYVAMNDCNGAVADNRGAYKIRILTGLPGKSKHNVPCPCANDEKVRSGNPIELADGNKVLSMTDFVLQTASGTLAFEREYNQSQRNNPRYQFMGLGWSHRLGETLVVAGTSPTRTAQVYFANGGVLKLNENGANQFVAEAGSTSSMTVSGANFILTAQDKSTYEFEPTATSGLFRLKIRRWPTTEAWSYSYTSDKLVQVDDGYGRQIKLSYRTAAGFDNGQLWRVGDQTASGLDTATPSGRYVEFTYTPEKNNGVTIANPKALLTSVRDVRGQVWSYEYYGQLAGQNDMTQLNLLTKRLSPSVDTNGDGTLDGNLTLEELIYTYTGSVLSQVVQKRGNALLQTTFKLRPGNRSETEEIVAGLSRFHLFTEDNGENGTYVGTEVANTIPDNGTSPDDNSQVSLTVPNPNYRPNQQVDGEGNVTDLQWSTDGKLLNKVTDALNRQTNFQYNTGGTLADTLRDSLDAENNRTNYIYETGQRQPSIILVSQDTASVTEIDVKGTMENLADWPIVGAGATRSLSVNPDSGDFSRFVQAGAANQGIESAPWNLVAGRSYTISARVYPVSGVVRMQVPGSSVPTAQSSGLNAWQTLSVNHTPAANVNNATLQFIANAGAATFYVDSVSVRENGIDLEVEGHMENKIGWDGIPGQLPVANVRRPGRVAGTNSMLVQTTAADQGIRTNLGYQPIAGKNHVIIARVYPISGQVKMTIPEVSGVQAFSKTGSLDMQTWQTLRLTVAPTPGNQSVRFLSQGGPAEFYVDAVHVIPVTNLARWQDFIYDNRMRLVDEAKIDPIRLDAPSERWQRTYHYSGNGNGLLASVAQLEGYSSNTHKRTEYTYDSAGRIIKARETSLLGTCQASFTAYDEAGNTRVTFCTPRASTAPVAVGSDPEAYYFGQYVNGDDKLTISRYDTLGRRVSVKELKQKNTTIQNSVWVETLMFYDAMDRVVRTIQNYVNQSGGVAEAPATWLWDAIDQRWEKSGGVAISHGTDNTQNLISDTEFNPRGLVQRTQDTLGNVTFYAYDHTGRLVKTIHSASQPTYPIAGDPSLSNYMVSAAPDLDLVTIQEYDGAGNLVKMVDPLGNVNFNVYDMLNRLVKTIANAKDTATILLNPGDAGYLATNDPRSSSYVASTNADRDHIQSTEYDLMGNVLRQSDVSGRVTYTVDRRVLSRTVGEILTIANYVPQGTSNPVDWSWNATTKLWMFPGPSSLLPVDLGAKNDQNIISVTNYDYVGRVTGQRDMLARERRLAYDILNRPVMDVVNYIDQVAIGIPDFWYWDTTDQRWEGNSNLAISFGSNFDQNQISQTVYNYDGSLLSRRDTRGRVVFYTYDTAGRLSKTVDNYVEQGFSHPIGWSWSSANNRWESNPGIPVSFGTDNDENRISQTEYDLQGRVASVRDAAGIQTRYEYDILGRRTKTITNYVDGIFNPAFPDEDLIAIMAYDRTGRVVSTTDARGTQTTFSYDRLGRQRIATRAANTSLATLSYTCYDKAGRVLRTIQNWSNNPTQPSPDAKDVGGNWLFRPTNGASDRDLITEYQLDRVGRQVQIIDPMGNVTQMTYDKSGQVISLTDPENMVTRYCYDNLRRRWRVVQNFIDQGQDSALWVWDGSQSRWETSTNIAIAHGANNDQNIIVDVAYDKAGRVINQREPRGNLTTYEYDLLDRRTKLTNPLNTQWLTAYSNPGGGKTRQTMTYPGLGAGTYAVIRDFDKSDRLQSIAYGDPANTRDVRFTYDVAGNRQKMSEFSAANFTSKVRETNFSYDDVRRLMSVGFDSNGDGTVDETVSYQYDAGGLRTRLTMPGGLQVNYTYDAKGQLISLTDWDSQPTTFAYDQVGRHIATERPERIRSRYQYDAGGRLRLLRHMQGSRTLSQFAYEVDRRGNRTRALEVQAHPATTTDTTIAFNDKGILTVGAWADVSGFKETTAVAARLSLLFLGNQAILTMGTGPDHGIYDVYIGGSLWDSFNGYANAAGQVNLTLPLVGSDLEGPHVLEIRVRQEKSALSTGYKVRFNQLVITDATFTLNLIGYTYDGLSRLRDAKYYPGINTAALDADLPRRYQYQFDRSGNRTQQSIALNGAAPTVTNYTYNAANRITNAGFTYDPNGNLIAEGNNTYTWDRANRMLETLRTVGADSWNTKYRYDGLGNRTNKNSFALVGGLEGIGPAINYLIDLQPGLAVTLREQGYFIHGPRGVHAEKGFGWSWMLQDGLGSVRGMVNSGTGMAGGRAYDPYGVQFAGFGGAGTSYGFTGEITDSNGSNTMVHLRTRNYNPALGVFTALDPFEGYVDELIFHNRYGYADANPVNLTDRTGLCAQPTEWWNPIDVNCYYSAVGLAQRFSQGNQQTYNEWFNVLITKPWHELKGIEALGSSADATGSLNRFMQNSSILPTLFVRNPQLALQAVQQWGCENNIDLNFLTAFTTAGTLRFPGVTGIGRIAVGGAPIVLAALGGLAAGIIISLLFAGTSADTDTQDEDPCSEEEMSRRIGTSTVASQIVGTPDLYPNQNTVDRIFIVRIASRMCRYGYDINSPITYWQFKDRKLIIEGHHRFVASFVAGVMPVTLQDSWDVSEFESPPSRIDWSQVRIR